MKKTLKITGIIVLVILILGGLFWKNLAASFVLEYTASELCSFGETSCDKVPQQLPLLSENVTPQDTVSYAGLVAPLPFAIASSSQDGTWLTLSGDAERTPMQRIVISEKAFDVARKYMRSTTSTFGMSEAGKLTRETVPIERNFFEQAVTARVKKVIETDPSRYAFLRDVLYFTTDDVSHFTTFNNKIAQYVYLNEKQNLTHPGISAIYAFENEAIHGFVTVWDSPQSQHTSIYELYIFNQKNPIQSYEMIVWNLTLPEVATMLAGVEISQE